MAAAVDRRASPLRVARSHIGHIFTKLGVRDRAAAIVFAFDDRLVLPS